MSAIDMLTYKTLPDARPLSLPSSRCCSPFQGTSPLRFPYTSNNILQLLEDSRPLVPRGEIQIQTYVAVSKRSEELHNGFGNLCQVASYDTLRYRLNPDAQLHQLDDSPYYRNRSVHHPHWQRLHWVDGRRQNSSHFSGHGCSPSCFASLMSFDKYIVIAR